MRSTCILAAALIVMGTVPLPAQGRYVKAGEIPVGGAASWDYAAVDSAAHRLYVSHGTEVVVIDLATNAVVGRVAAGPGVHGIAINPSLNRIYISNGRGANPDGTTGNVSIVDAKSLETLSKVQTGLNPDAILYDPTQKEVYSFNHTGKSVTVFAADSGKVAATIPLAGVAEFGQVDGNRVFVNIEDKDAIDVIDTTRHEVVAHWLVAPAGSPTGMALDAASHRLFVGGGKAVVMIDETSGKVTASVPICGGTDATAFDPGSKLVFVSCSDGTVTIARVDGPQTLTVVQTLDTARGSRTMTIDPSTHRIYLAAGDRQVPDSFRILIFAPGQ